MTSPGFLRSLWWSTLALAFLIATGCVGGGTDRGDEGGEGGPSIITDSAGLRVVSSSRPSLGNTSALSVDPEPFLQVGMEGSEIQFGSVADATRRSDGVLAVVDRMTHEIIVVNSAGRLLQRVGGRGAGPGEFQRPPVVAWSEGDTLLAWDPGSVRVSWFDPRGKLARERSLASLLRSTPVGNGSWQIASDGTLLGRISTTSSGEVIVERIRVLSVPGDADTVVQIGEYEGVPSILRAGWMISSRFPHRLAVALSPDGQEAYLAEDETWEVQRFRTRTGALDRLFRVAVPRTPVTQEMVDEEREEWRERAGDRVSASTYLDVVDEFEVPDSVPGIYRMYVDESNNLWVGRRITREPEGPREYIVLDPSGRWITTAHLPEDLGFMADVSRDAIVTRASGTFGESVVNVHTIQR